MKPGIKKFFELSSIERKGVIILIAVILIIISIQTYLTINIPVNNTKNLILEPDSELINIKLTEKTKESSYVGKTSLTETQLFKFNPNTITIEEMKKLGMSDITIKSLNNYRLKGGRFYKQDDIRKIYGLSPGLFELLRPYIIINAEKKTKEKDFTKTEIGIHSQCDINYVDTTELQLIKGIGRILAARIVKYRNLLGGYYSIDQLKEVYGLTQEKILIINKNYFADTAKIIKISLNQASERELSRHPYIGKYTANAIINYRRKVVIIRSINEIFKNGIISGNEYEKLKKYLAI